MIIISFIALIVNTRIAIGKISDVSKQTSNNIDAIKSETNWVKDSLREMKKNLTYRQNINRMYELFNKREKIKNSWIVNKEELENIESLINYTTSFDSSFVGIYDEKLNDIETKMKEVRKDFKQYKNEIDRISHELNESQESEIELTDRLRKLNDEYNKLVLKSGELWELEKKIRLANSVLEENQQNKEKIDNNISSLDCEYDYRRYDTEQLKDEIIKLGKLFSNMNENSNLEQNILDKKKIIEDLETTENNLKERLNSIINNINNVSNNRKRLLNEVSNDANKILYTVGKNLSLDLYNTIDSNIISYFSIVDNFKFSFSSENIDKKNLLNFSSNINKFTFIKANKVSRYDSFGIILSYNNINTKDHKITLNNNGTIISGLDSKNIVAGAYLKYFIVNDSNLFTNIKLAYGFSRNKQNYSIGFINNSDKFNSHQIMLQTGLGSDLMADKVFKLSAKVDINTTLLDINKRYLNIGNTWKKFDSEYNTFIALTPNIFLNSNQFYINDHSKINFGMNLFYNKALSNTKMLVNGERKNIDKDIFGFGLNTGLLINDNVNLGLNYNLYKTRKTGSDKVFGIGAGLGVWF